MNLRKALLNVEVIAKREYQNFQSEKNDINSPFSYELALELEGLYIIPSDDGTIDFDYGECSSGKKINASPNDSLSEFTKDLKDELNRFINN